MCCFHSFTSVVVLLSSCLSRVVCLPAVAAASCALIALLFTPCFICNNSCPILALASAFSVFFPVTYCVSVSISQRRGARLFRRSTSGFHSQGVNLQPCTGHLLAVECLSPKAWRRFALDIPFFRKLRAMRYCMPGFVCHYTAGWQSVLHTALAMPGNTERAGRG